MEPDQIETCDQCGTPISDASADCPQCSKRGLSPKTPAVPVLLALMVVVSSVLMLGTSVVNITTVSAQKIASSVQPEIKPSDMRLAAYEAARKFVIDRHRRLQNFSEFNRSPIEQTGNLFTITLSSDDFSAPNNPVRSFFNVTVEYSSEGWKLKELKQ